MIKGYKRGDEVIDSVTAVKGRIIKTSSYGVVMEPYGNRATGCREFRWREAYGRLRRLQRDILR